MHLQAELHLLVRLPPLIDRVYLYICTYAVQHQNTACMFHLLFTADKPVFTAAAAVTAAYICILAVLYEDEVEDVYDGCSWTGLINRCSRDKSIIETNQSSP